MEILRQDTDGVRAILNVGELAVDNYAAGNDVGRVWTGNGTNNRALAFKDELVSGSGSTSVVYDQLPQPAVGNSLYWVEDANRYVYGNPVTGRYYYLSTDAELMKPGQGLGSAGTYVESWEDDISIIMQRWNSKQLQSSNNGGTTGKWNKHSGATGSSTTGPASANDGSYYMYTECSSNGHTVDFQLNTTDFAKLTEVEFDYHAYGANTGVASLEVREADKWIVVWSVTGDQGNAWHTAVVDCTNVQAEELRFRHVGAKGFTADFAIDKVKVTSV